MNTLETEALILRTKDFGESDRLIDLFTKSRGRLKGIAKGARRSKKRFMNVFEPLNLVELSYGERKSLIWIDACKLLDPHSALRTEIERWGAAALISELVLEMAPEGEPHEDLFYLLRDALDHLSSDKDPVNALLLFIFRFMDIMGYLPAMESCSECKRHVESTIKSTIKWWWLIGRGALVCSEHRILEEDCVPLDVGTLVLIRNLRRLQLDKVWRMRFHNDKKLPILQGLLDWVRGTIRKDLKTLKVLVQLEGL